MPRTRLDAPLACDVGLYAAPSALLHLECLDKARASARHSLFATHRACYAVTPAHLALALACCP
eukprot:606698-Pleurochrysis_carterae.AAC.1